MLLVVKVVVFLVSLYVLRESYGSFLSFHDCDKSFSNGQVAFIILVILYFDLHLNFL